MAQRTKSNKNKSNRNNNNNYRQHYSDRKASDAQKEAIGQELAVLLANSLRGNKDPFQDFVGLTQKLKQKQDELDMMAADSLPAAILTDYVSDVLLPNSNGDLVQIVADNPNHQLVVNSIYQRLALPGEKIVYSLCKNGIVIGEFEQVARQSVAKQVAANEEVTDSIQQEARIAEAIVTDEAPAIGKKVASFEHITKENVQAAIEQTYVRDPGTIMPNVSILYNTYTVFPILRYEKCVGYIEVRKDAAFFEQFVWETDTLDYTDVVIHQATDYAYETFGVPRSSKPLQLRVTNESGTVEVYEIATGCSMLEDAYTSWKTLSLLEDSIVLASLIKNAQIMLVECEAGTASKQQIEAAKIKLRSLFEGQLSMGKQGMKSYLNPQAKPAFVYSFVSNGVGKITANLVGGEYNPGQLYYLTPFVNQFFAAMGAPKQNYGFTEGAGGLDGGGAVEQYTQRYKATVARLKRIYGSFIKKCINNVLMAKGLTNLVDAFEVKVYGAYDETRNQELQEQQTKLSFYESIINFMKVDDEKQPELRSLLIKEVITNPQVTKIIDQVLTKTEAQQPPENDESLDDLNDSQLSDDVANELGLDLPDDGPPLEIDEGDLTPPEPSSNAPELPEMSDVLTEG